MKEFSRRKFLKLVPLAAIGILTGFKGDPQSCSIQAGNKESSPKNELEMNTEVVVMVGSEYFEYYGFSSLKVSENGFEMGKNINPASTKEVYKEINGILIGPILNVRFAFSDPEICDFAIRKEKFNLKSVPIPYVQRDPFASGQLTVFDRTNSSKIIKRRFLIDTPGPFAPEDWFGNKGVSIARVRQILESGKVTRIPNRGSLEIFLTEEGNGPIAYLAEFHSHNAPIPNNIV